MGASYSLLRGNGAWWLVMAVVTAPRPPQPQQEVDVPLTVDILRALFRALTLFRAVYEETGQDTIHRDGITVTLWDVEYLFEQSQKILPERQAQSIRYFLVDNMFESEVAVKLGTKATNPVGMYATKGMETIIGLIEAGALPRYREVG